MRRALACGVLLAAAGLAPAAAVAQAAEAYDFEAAGGAIAAVRMHEGAADGIAEYCKAQVPTTAREWDEAVEAWDARHAPWRVATDVVRTEAFAKLREGGEDPTLLEAMLGPIVKDFVDSTVGEVTALAETAGAETVCASAYQLMTAGRFDVDKNEYTPAIDMLRAHLPKSSP